MRDRQRSCRRHRRTKLASDQVFVSHMPSQTPGAVQFYGPNWGENPDFGHRIEDLCRSGGRSDQHHKLLPSCSSCRQSEPIRCQDSINAKNFHLSIEIISPSGSEVEAKIGSIVSHVILAQTRA